jgi:hypothetical protein
MKKHVGLGLLVSMSTALFCSEGNEVARLTSKKSLGNSQEINLGGSGGKSIQSLRASTEALVIAATKAATAEAKSRARDCFSSGSSPAGTEHLFPGQKGNGLSTQWAPIHYDGVNYHGWH